MIKPQKLQKGDKVATISLSWGGAGEFPQRYAIGKQQIEKEFGLEVIATKHALTSAEWIYNNPEARADDLKEALEDRSIKAIISNIGGDDSIRLLRYMDLEHLRQNPKIFIGFSDSTITHFCFYKAGITSFYGTSLLVGFAENNGMHPYQVADIKQTLFSSQPVGQIYPNTSGWTSERLEWAEPANQTISRQLQPHTGWRFLQGSGIVSGELLGGCLESLENLKATSYWVPAASWKGKIMFVETSEIMLNPDYFCWIFRNYAASGILHNIQGLILGRPYHNKFWKEYDQAILQVMKEEGLIDLPIISGMDFGHTCPIFSLPYGIMAEINVDERTFSITEAALVD